MKILNIYIHSFGKLSNFKYDFNSGLNKIKEENGFGKTTLAVFIKSMFYGLKDKSRSQINENERVKYFTWNSTSLIGGTLDFELDEVPYRIERYFGKKSSDDTFKVFNLKLNKLETKYTENIGEEIFGIDVNSYERSTYLPSTFVELNKNNSSLSQKLTNLTYGTNDITTVDDVIGKLDKKCKEYSKSKSGLIATAKKEIFDLEREVDFCKVNFKNAEELNSKIANLNLEIDEITKELNLLKPKIENAISKNAARQEYEKQLKNIEIEKARYKELKEDFDKVEVTLEILDSYLTLSNELIKIETKLDTLDETINSEKFKEFDAAFGNANFTLKDVDNMILKAQTKTYNTQKSSNTMFYVFIVLGLIISITSIALMFVNVALIAGLVLGALLIILPIIFKDKFTTTSPNLDESNNFDEVTTFLNNNGFDTTNPLNSLNQIKSDMIVYLNMLSNMQEGFKKQKELTAQKLKIDAAINKFLLNFYNQINESYDVLLNDVKDRYKEYMTLDDKLKNFDNRISEYSTDDSTNLDSLKLKEQEINKILDEKVSEREKLTVLKNSNLDNANNILDIEQELAAKEQLLIKYQKDYANLSITMELIKSAKENLRSKYLEPITNGFLKHLRNLGNGIVDTISIDTNLNINVVEKNSLHDLDFYSSGYKDLINICLRLSLIDAMFKDSAPPIILDDPFINLDDNKLKSMMDVLDNAAKNYQIIYLTCNSSRM